MQQRRALEEMWEFVAVHIFSNYAFDLRILAFCLCCCRGWAFFCGKRRLKDGWKGQKTMHGCRNSRYVSSGSCATSSIPKKTT